MQKPLDAQEWAEIANVLNEAANVREELRGIRDRVRVLAREAEKHGSKRVTVVVNDMVVQGFVDESLIPAASTTGHCWGSVLCSSCNAKSVPIPIAISTEHC